jgi:hypothetical protein
MKAKYEKIRCSKMYGTHVYRVYTNLNAHVLSTVFQIWRFHRFDYANHTITPGRFVNSYTRSSETSVLSPSSHDVTFQKTGNLHSSIPHPPSSFLTEAKWLLNVPRVKMSLCAAICGEIRHTVQGQNRWR